MAGTVDAEIGKQIILAERAELHAVGETNRLSRRICGETGKKVVIIRQSPMDLNMNGIRAMEQNVFPREFEPAREAFVRGRGQRRKWVVAGLREQLQGAGNRIRRNEQIDIPAVLHCQALI